MDKALEFVLFSFATFRLALMVGHDDLPFAIMWRLRNHAGRKSTQAQTQGFWWTVSEILNCPLCAGIWLTPVVYFLFPDWLLWLFAIAGLQAFLSLAVLERE